MSARIRELRAPGRMWEITACAERVVLSQAPAPPGAATVDLNTVDPRVGMIAVWGSTVWGTKCYVGAVRAVVRQAGKDTSLLLEDSVGYPWAYAPLDARVVSLAEGDYQC